MSFIGYFVAISKEARLQPLRACQSMMRIAQSKEREMGGMATPPIRVRITSVKRGNVKKRQRKTRAKCEYRTLYLTSPGERVRIVFLVPIFLIGVFFLLLGQASNRAKFVSFRPEHFVRNEESVLLP